MGVIKSLLCMVLLLGTLHGGKVTSIHTTINALANKSSLFPIFADSYECLKSKVLSTKTKIMQMSPRHGRLT